MFFTASFYCLLPFIAVCGTIIKNGFRGVLVALYIALGVCVALEFVFVPWFLKVMWPDPSKKSLLLKMICASLFVAVGVISMYISDNRTEFAYTMLLGLVFGWLGDFFLHVNSTQTCFGIGFTSFLIGHIVYIISYVRALSNIFPDYPVISLAEIGVALILCVCALVCYCKLKLDMPGIFVKLSMGTYFLILVTMFIKATALGVNYMLSGGEYGIVALLVLVLGSLCFVMSDVVLGVIMFGGLKKNYPIKIFNIVTYFAGQVLLASSILFIKG